MWFFVIFPIARTGYMNSYNTCNTVMVIMIKHQQGYEEKKKD